MATSTYVWNAKAQTLNIAIEDVSVYRESEPEWKNKFCAKLKVKWWKTWSSTNYGMKAVSGGKTSYFPKFDGDVFKSSDECTITGTYSIDTTNKKEVEIEVTLTNYKDDSTGSNDTKTFKHKVTVPKYIGIITDAAFKIQDNYNNTFNFITSYSGGVNDTVTQIINWGYTSSLGKSIKLDDNKTGTSTKCSLTDIDANKTKAARKIYYQYIVEGKETKAGRRFEGNTDDDLDFPDIKQYVAPSAPGKPSLTNDSYKNGRLTVKLPWTFTWTKATKTNDSSPVKGYRIRLWVKTKGNSSFINTPIYDSSGKQLSVYDDTTNQYYYDNNTTTNSIVIYPDKQDLKVGDQFYITIYSYSRFGKKNDGTNAGLFNNGGTSEAAVKSEKTYTVQNAGIMRVRVDNEWKEGQVYVKTETGWKEASSIHVKTDGGWKEST